MVPVSRENALEHFSVFKGWNFGAPEPPFDFIEAPTTLFVKSSGFSEDRLLRFGQYHSPLVSQWEFWMHMEKLTRQIGIEYFQFYSFNDCIYKHVQLDVSLSFQRVFNLTYNEWIDSLEFHSLSFFRNHAKEVVIAEMPCNDGEGILVAYDSRINYSWL